MTDKQASDWTTEELTEFLGEMFDDWIQPFVDIPIAEALEELLQRVMEKRA